MSDDGSSKATPWWRVILHSLVVGLVVNLLIQPDFVLNGLFHSTPLEATAVLVGCLGAGGLLLCLWHLLLAPLVRKWTGP